MWDWIPPSVPSTKSVFAFDSSNVLRAGLFHDSLHTTLSRILICTLILLFGDTKCASRMRIASKSLGRGLTHLPSDRAPRGSNLTLRQLSQRLQDPLRLPDGSALHCSLPPSRIRLSRVSDPSIPLLSVSGCVCFVSVILAGLLQVLDGTTGAMPASTL
jgi:hypothetical protein